MHVHTFWGFIWININKYKWYLQQQKFSTEFYCSKCLDYERSLVNSKTYSTSCNLSRVCSCHHLSPFPHRENLLMCLNYHHQTLLDFLDWIPRLYLVQNVQKTERTWPRITISVHKTQYSVTWTVFSTNHYTFLVNYFYKLQRIALLAKYLRRFQRK